MSRKSLVDRLSENEVIFRQYNEQAQQGLKNLKKVAKEDGNGEGIRDDLSLHFYCECSDENCTKRIVLKPSEYAEIHQQRDRFILIPGHEAEIIEHVILQKGTYNIVEKHAKPPKSADMLNTTPIDNS